jgi:hypothetical protein
MSCTGADLPEERGSRLVLDDAGKFENQHGEDTDQQEPGHPCEFPEFFIFVFECAEDLGLENSDSEPSIRASLLFR